MRWVLLTFAVSLVVALGTSPAVAQIIDEPDPQPRRVDCPAGQVAVSGHCCWPEQLWDRKRKTCRGIPSCPDGMVVDGEVCLSTLPDSDHDGTPDRDDKCPLVAEDSDGFDDDDGCPDEDNDADGVADVDDKCPNEPEDLDQHEDEDGCRDPDNDGDLVADEEDQCPLDPEDIDQHEDDDGCPDPDNDGDGIADGDDACPDAAEDGVGAADGCPAPDRDGDGMADMLDPCPDQAEDGLGPADGCPGEPGMSGASLAGWALVGSGVAVAGGGVVLHLVAEGVRDEVRGANSAANGQPILDIKQTEAKQKEDDANTIDTIGAISMGVGGVAVVTGVVLLLWPDDAGDVEVSGAMNATGGLLTVSGRF